MLLKVSYRTGVKPPPHSLEISRVGNLINTKLKKINTNIPIFLFCSWLSQYQGINVVPDNLSSNF